MKKILSIKDLNKKIIDLRKKNSRLKFVLCHGAFDLLHPGHIDHLELAKKGCDVLIVSITTDKFIKKSTNSPFYNQFQRAKFLSSLEIVDYVCYSEDVSSIPILKILRPDIYCKGEEYKKKDLIGNLKKEKKFCKESKIKIKLIGKQKFSSSKIIANHFFKSSDLELDKNIQKFLKGKDNDISLLLDKLKKLKILIIGEIIFDKYTYVSSKGVSPKSNSLSCSIVNSKIMPGGTLATYNYLKQFTKHVKLFSIVNSSLVKKYKNLFDGDSKKNLIISSNFEKIIKERIVENDKINSLKKIITLNHFTNILLEKKIEDKIVNFLKHNLKKFDIVLVQDFGHGLISQSIANLIQEKSKFLSLNVQTNSLNYGFNIIGRKFKKADLLTLDKKEFELYVGKKFFNYNIELKNLSKKLGTENIFLTCGDDFTVGFDKNNFQKINTLGKDVTDTIGAGDIFHATSTLLSYTQKNLFLTVFLSQITGALAVKIIGNSDFPKIYQIKQTYDLYLDSIK